MADSVTTRDGTFEIRSEAHGPHWVAWLARTPDGGPEQSVLLVGQTQAEAEARARMWASDAAEKGRGPTCLFQSSPDPRNLSHGDGRRHGCHRPTTRRCSAQRSFASSDTTFNPG
jgi:hypothetical protein